MEFYKYYNFLYSKDEWVAIVQALSFQGMKPCHPTDAQGQFTKISVCGRKCIVWSKK